MRRRKLLRRGRLLLLIVYFLLTLLSIAGIISLFEEIDRLPKNTQEGMIRRLNKTLE